MTDLRHCEEVRRSSLHLVRDCFGTITHREIIMPSPVPRNDGECNDDEY